MKDHRRASSTVAVRAVVLALVLCAGAAAYAHSAFAAVPLINAQPTSFGSGQKVDLIGTGFAADSDINVWFDANDDHALGSNEQSTVAHTDASGDFSNVELVVKSQPGTHFIRAGGPPAVALAEVTIGTCWFQDCFINGADTICIFGNSPTDELHDCKALDSSYGDASAGYNLGNTGPRFAGAGVLAAAVNDLGLPGTGCAAMTAAILDAETTYGTDVPGKFDLFKPDQGLLNIACGPPFGPVGFIGFNLPLYMGAEAVAGHGSDPAMTDALVILGLVGTVNAAAATANAAIPGSGLVILAAAQLAVAKAAVAGAIACGHVNYFCNGADITFNLLLKNDLQTKFLPIPLIGKRWGDIIGWAKPVCHDNTLPAMKADGSGFEKGACEVAGDVPTPGSAGSNNALADNRCATGKVVGMSIGYDGDISFDINDGANYGPNDINPASGQPYPPGTLNPMAPGPNIAPFTNYHNFLPGPGGSDAPGGIDVEIPVYQSALFLPQLLAMRKGLTVRVCGQWVADMHQSWNEFHPVTAVTILAAKTPPTVLPVISGTLGDNGWYTSDVALSWNVDSHPALDSSTGCGAVTITADTPGQTFTCSATNADGTTTHSITVKRDATAPTISRGVSPPVDGTNGWYISPPTVTFSCADTGGSGLDGCIANSPMPLGESPLSQNIIGTATDGAGNVAHDSVPMLVDLSDPTISAALDRAPNANGWYRAPVHVAFTCADGISGISTCGPNVDLVEGGNQSVSGTAVDVAGRSTSTSLSGISIDTTPPTVAFSGNAGTYTVSQTVAITCAASDALSGLATNTCANTNGPAWSFGVGTTVLSAGATDKADNPGSASTSFKVSVTPSSLCLVTKQFVQGSAKYAALTTLQKATINALVTTLCQKLDTWTAYLTPTQQAAIVHAYTIGVQALVPLGWLTQAQATTLISLANAL